MGITVLDAQVTENDIANTTTETDLLSYSVPGGTLGTSGALRIQLVCDYLNNSAGTSTVTLKIKYGATTMYDDVTIAFPVAASRYPIMADLTLFAKNATNSQGIAGKVVIGISGGATNGIGNLATDEINGNVPLVGANAAEDSTAAKTFAITITHQTADAAISFRRLYSVIKSVTLAVAAAAAVEDKRRAFSFNPIQNQDILAAGTLFRL